MPADLNDALSAGLNPDLAVPTALRPVALLPQERYLLLSLCVIISSANASNNEAVGLCAVEESLLMRVRRENAA